MLGITVTNQNGENVASFPAGNDADLQKLRDAGYVLLMEEVFVLNPPKQERIITLEDVVGKFFEGKDVEVQSDDDTWHMTVGEGDKVAEVYHNNELQCGIHENAGRYIVEPYHELSAIPAMVVRAMQEKVTAMPTELAEYTPTFETPLDHAKHLINNFCEAEYGDDADFSDLHHVAIAYTTLTDNELPVQVTADLVDYTITYEFDGETYNTDHFDSLESMIENGLTGLDFSELVSVPDDVIERHTAQTASEAHISVAVGDQYRSSPRSC